MALQAIEHKRELIESRASIREVVFGMQDGLISTVGLLTGVQGATESNTVVIITGLTAMFAGAVSMSAGSYLSSSAEKETYLAAEGLLKALSQEGLPRDQSYGLVKSLLNEQQVFLRTFREKVFGLGSAELNRPFQAALVMGLSFAVGALVPILPYLILSGRSTLYVSIALSAVTLFGVGAIKGKLSGKSLFVSGTQFFAIAVGAAVIAYLIGLTVQHFFPDVSVSA